MVPSLPLLSCELSGSVKENPDRKKKKNMSDIRSAHVGHHVREGGILAEFLKIRCAND